MSKEESSKAGSYPLVGRDQLTTPRLEADGMMRTLAQKAAPRARPPNLLRHVLMLTWDGDRSILCGLHYRVGTPTISDFSVVLKGGTLPRSPITLPLSPGHSAYSASRPGGVSGPLASLHAR